MKSKYCNKARGTRSHLGTNKLPSNRRHQKNVIKETETNLSRFWRECRERDIRKRRKTRNQFPSNHNHFNSTKSKLKLDAEILSNRFQRINSLKNNKENRRNSMFNNSRNISKANKNTNRRFSNIYIPSSTNTSNNKTNGEQTQSENTKIFFENKEYYSSLYTKHNLRKSNIHSVHNYFDSLKSDENTIKTRLRQKWQELKKDVNKLNYFNNNKLNKTTQKINLSNTTIQQPSVRTEASKPRYYPTPKSNLTYCFKLPPQKEQKDPESQSNETITQLEPEMFEDNILKTPKSEEITVESVENIQNIQQSEIIEDTHDHSSIYCLSNVAKSNEYWDLSVRQLKNKLLNMNVSINNCIEKKDLIEKIKTCATNNNESTNTLNNKYYRKQAPKSAKDVHSKCVRTSFSNKNKPSILYDTIFNDTRESKQQIMKRIDVWIHRWSYRRNFRQLLNSIFEYKLNDKRYLSRHDDNYLLMMKLYKKAILLIHPDKHINSSFEIKYKSAEMFKILINIADRYKKKHEVRNKAY